MLVVPAPSLLSGSSSTLTKKKKKRALVSKSKVGPIATIGLSTPILALKKRLTKKKSTVTATMTLVEDVTKNTSKGTSTTNDHYSDNKSFSLSNPPPSNNKSMPYL